MSFKIGQKVVYIGGCSEPMMRCPQIDSEIIEIFKVDEDSGRHFILCGYEKASDGLPQSFWQGHLRALDYNFVEEIIKQVQPKETA